MFVSILLSCLLFRRLTRASFPPFLLKDFVCLVVIILNSTFVPHLLESPRYNDEVGDYNPRTFALVRDFSSQRKPSSHESQACLFTLAFFDDS